MQLSFEPFNSKRETKQEKKRGKKEISDNGTSHSQNKSNTQKKYRVSEGHRSFKYQCFENASEATAWGFVHGMALALSTHELLV